MMTLPTSFDPDVAPLTVMSCDSIACNSVQLFLSCNTLCQASSNQKFLDTFAGLWAALCPAGTDRALSRGVWRLTSNPTFPARTTEPRQLNTAPPARAVNAGLGPFG